MCVCVCVCVHVHTTQVLVLTSSATGKANAVAQAINDAEPGRAIAVVGDVQDADYIETLVKKAAEFGNGKIHIIVNNAGFTWDGVIHKVRWPFPILNICTFALHLMWRAT